MNVNLNAVSVILSENVDDDCLMLSNKNFEQVIVCRLFDCGKPFYFIVLC